MSPHATSSKNEDDSNKTLTVGIDRHTHCSAPLFFSTVHTRPMASRRFDGKFCVVFALPESIYPLRQSVVGGRVFAAVSLSQYRKMFMNIFITLTKYYRGDF